MNILMLYPRFFEPTFWNPHCSSRLLRDRGIHIIDGFIVGFDEEDPRGFEIQQEFIEASGIAVSIVGPLGAIPNTQLSRRLAEEERLLPPLNQFTLNSFDGHSEHIVWELSQYLFTPAPGDVLDTAVAPKPTLPILDGRVMTQVA